MSESIPTPRVWLIDWYTPERFDAKVQYPETPDGCWIWTGARSTTGYGHTTIRGKYWGAHRISYEAHVGPIPEGLDLDHLCRVRECVRPDHLEPVTRAENVRRGVPFKKAAPRPTHCPKGHPYPDSRPPGQSCRECAKAHKALPESKAAHNRRRRERYAADAEYREAVKATNRERYATDPEFRARAIASAKSAYEAKTRQREEDASS